MPREQAEIDRYLGLVAAGWALTITVPMAAAPIAFLLMERRTGHAIGMLSVLVLEIVVLVLVVVTIGD
jgi:hypothetical protein